MPVIEGEEEEQPNPQTAVRMNNGIARIDPIYRTSSGRSTELFDEAPYDHVTTGISPLCALKMPYGVAEMMIA